MNNVKTFVLRGGLLSLCVLAGQLLGGSQGLVLGLALGGLMSVGSYFFSDPTDELEGAIAHELAHIKNRDMLISTVAAVIAGALSNLPCLLMFGGGRDDEDTHPLARLESMVRLPA